jgi:hypothetical protein
VDWADCIVFLYKKITTGFKDNLDLVHVHIRLVLAGTAYRKRML